MYFFKIKEAKVLIYLKRPNFKDQIHDLNDITYFL
ncbi:hypothetical protein FBBAL38_05030 [Flavobacteria bacterium BAL38]|nr:hypothetical protein FBBAL38_05030 [Flavobacteria bacterium BAL38]